MKVTVIQLNSKTNKKKNLNDALQLAEKAIVADKPDLIAFPEMMAFYGGTDEDKKSSAEDIPGGETTQQLSTLAKTNKIFVPVNQFPYKLTMEIFANEDASKLLDKKPELIDIHNFYINNCSSCHKKTRNHTFIVKGEKADDSSLEEKTLWSLFIL